MASKVVQANRAMALVKASGICLEDEGNLIQSYAHRQALGMDIQSTTSLGEFPKGRRTSSCSNR